MKIFKSRNLLFVVAGLLFSTTMTAQFIPENVKLSSDSDTSFWLKYNQKKNDQLYLAKLTLDSVFFRIRSEKWLIELVNNSGKLYFYTEEVTNGKKTGKIFTKSFQLSNNQVKDINKQAEILGIDNIPDMKFINEWEQGFDGVTYIIEYKRHNDYSFKTYWSPHLYINHIKEADSIQRFVTSLLELTDHQSKFTAFENEIPFRNWTYNDGRIAVRVPKY